MVQIPLHSYNRTLLINVIEFPQIILNIEKVELGISAGLQDRVIQTRGGLVHMDFSEAQFASRGTGLYTDLDTALLPPFYLAYNVDVGTMTWYAV